MDNLKKRDYANFNNARNRRGNLPNRNELDRREDGRYGYNARSSRSNDINKSNGRNVPIQYSKNRNQGNQKANIYESITSTVQKKFNNVLYKGKNQHSGEKINKSSVTRMEHMNQMEKIKRLDRMDKIKRLDQMDTSNKNIHKKEEEATVPKSVFIFITIAVIFATGLAVMLTKPDDKSDKKLVDNSQHVSRTSQQTDEDDGFETFADEDIGDLDDLEETEEDDEDLQSEVEDDEVPTSSASNDAISTTSKTTDKKTSSSSNVQNGNVTADDNNNTVTTTNTPKATLKPEMADDDSNRELATTVADEGKFTLRSTVTGSLYKTSSSYAIVGYDGKFVKYTNFVKESFGTTIPKSDLDGIWVFSKTSSLSTSSITNVYGYRNGVEVDVCKVTITVEGSSTKKYMYVLKNTEVDLSDGTYKLSGSSSRITKLTVTGDRTIVEY